MRIPELSFLTLYRTVSLEEFKGGKEKERLTPRSIEALRRQGITADQLKYVSFKQIK